MVGDLEPLKEAVAKFHTFLEFEDNQPRMFTWWQAFARMGKDVIMQLAILGIR